MLGSRHTAQDPLGAGTSWVRGNAANSRAGLSLTSLFLGDMASWEVSLPLSAEQDLLLNKVYTNVNNWLFLEKEGEGSAG